MRDTITMAICFFILSLVAIPCVSSELPPGLGQIAFAGQEALSIYGVWLIDPYTEEITPIVGPASNYLNVPFLEWSPDGTKLSFITDRKLYLYDSTGKKANQLTNEAFYTSACWLGNTHLIAVRINTAGNSWVWELVHISLDGNARILYSTEDNIQHVSCSAETGLVVLGIESKEPNPKSLVPDRYLVTGLLEGEFTSSIRKLALTSYPHPQKVFPYLFCLSNNGKYLAYSTVDYREFRRECRIAVFESGQSYNPNIKRFLRCMPMAWNKSGDSLILYYSRSKEEESSPDISYDPIIYDFRNDQSCHIEIAYAGNKFLYQSFDWAQAADLIAYAQTTPAFADCEALDICIFNKEGKLLKQLNPKSIHVSEIAW